MNNLRSLISLVDKYIIEDILYEDFSKGSKTVLSNNKMIDALADAVKRDVRYNSQAFPPRFDREIRNMTNQQIAEWFLTKLDEIESEGYEGIIYSHNGVNNEWIVNNYIKRNHNWEDIFGTLSMILSKFYYLRNRQLLKLYHNNIGTYNGIRELGNYLVTHYNDQLANFQEQMAAQAQKRAIRKHIVVDNDDYRIYITLNRAANIKYGLGTTWCTASSSRNNTYFNTYASKAMLFQLYPYKPEEVKLTDRSLRPIEGKERYQFDAGGPHFMNIADRPPDKNYIRTKFPYLYYDLKTALENQKSQLQSYIDQNADDPKLTNDVYGKVMHYNVDEEIAKLERLKTAGWFTDEVRPPKSNDVEFTPDNQQLPSS